MVDEAVCLYLEAAASRDKLDALVLASDDGLLIAGTGSGDLTGFAAVGVACAATVTRTAALDQLVTETTCGSPLFVSAIRIREDLFYLVSVGGRVERPMEATDAITRILRPVLERYAA